MISPRRFPEPAKSRRERKNGALRRLAWYRELALTKMAAKDSVKPRERLLGAAYDLFARNGISKVGIETILAESGCAKASLYDNFDSKVDLAIAFLDRREALWTRGWLEAEVKRRASTPDGAQRSAASTSSSPMNAISARSSSEVWLSVIRQRCRRAAS